MKKLLLHIGTGKTGSSSIQRVFSDLSRSRGLRDLTYPVLSKKTNHNEITTIFQTHQRCAREFRSKYPDDDLKFRRFVSKIESKFRNYLFSEDNLVVSSEYLSGFNEGEVADFASYLRDFNFDQIKVLIYLREPSSYYLSAVQQRIKASHTFESPTSFFFDYVSIIKRWKRFFPDTEIREFDPKELINGSVVADFIDVCGRFLGCEFNSVEGSFTSSNQSLSAAGMRFLQTYRSVCHSGRDNQINAATNQLIKMVQEVEKSRSARSCKPRLSHQVERIIRCNHSEQVKELRKLLGCDIFKGFSPPESCGGAEELEFSGSVMDILHPDSVDCESVDRLIMEVVDKLLLVKA
ncbi:hypothetical protein [Microbulbifer zhoushanensis]|uniref:hypothetical protein n=1 Tax=Microbulbifer zhoushanensis TaxID=2904254 RepID=UPI001F4053B3|nr:hypothetical protein [Microbulbifer zhoushanensis]